MRRVCRVLIAAALGAFGLALLSGCLPDRFTIDLSPNDLELSEAVVIDEERTGGAKIALVHLDGAIGLGTAGLFENRSELVDRFIARMDEAAGDRSVKALLVRINSPGGTVSASEILFAEVSRFRAESGKPVVVSLGDIAASGGYYVALAGDEVYAQPSTITGSIGVLIQTLNYAEAMDKVGVSARTLVSRENKALASPFEPPVEEHYDILQDVVDDFYAQFVELVRSRRGERIDQSRFGELTDGRVLSGTAAHDAGLVDGVRSLRGSFERAKELAGVDAADLVVYARPGDAPATPYRAVSDASPAPLGRVNIGLINADGAGGLLGLRPGVAHYLWTPGVR